jgi:hypothetical protein
MSRTKDQWIEQTGGFSFLGANPAQKAEQLEALKKRLLSGKLTPDQMEGVQREMCRIQGIDFHAPDYDDDD